MVKPVDSQQVESEKTNKISPQVESSAIPPSPDRSVSFEITHKVTHGGVHVADEDVDDDEDQGSVMGDVQDSITVGRTRRNSCKPIWFTTNIIMAYALSVVEEAIPSTYMKAEISTKSKM